MHLQRVGELRAYSTQHIKWTTEGAVNRLGIILVFCNATQALTVRDMLVSCKEGLSAQTRWYRELDNYSILPAIQIFIPVLDLYFSHRAGIFIFGKEENSC